MRLGLRSSIVARRARFQGVDLSWFKGVGEEGGEGKGDGNPRHDIWKGPSLKPQVRHGKGGNKVVKG